MIPGEWRLVVVQDGCESSISASTEVLVSPNPPKPTLFASADELCEGDSILIEGQLISGGNVEYTWITPTGIETTSTHFIRINAASTADAGEYHMFVTVDGCESDTSNAVIINVYDIPPTPEIRTNTPVCEGAQILLSTDSITDSGARYFWTGPGWTSTLINPSITATPDLGGIYSLYVEVNGCRSQVATAQVQIIDLDNPPLVMNEGAVCLDDPDACIQLQVDPSTAINGAMYSWFRADNPSVVVCGPTPGLNCSICDLSDYDVGNTEFFLRATATGCTTQPSNNTIVEFQEIPSDVANAGGDIRICNETGATLNAEIPSPGISGSWTQTCGPPVSLGNINSPVTTVSGLTSGQEYCFVWTLDFEACGSDSDEVRIFVDEVGEQAVTCERLDVCNVTCVNLCADVPSSGIAGMWEQPQSQADQGVVILDPSQPNSQVCGLIPGNTYIFTWVLANNGCLDFSRADLIVRVEDALPLIAETEDDYSACGNGSIEICAATPNAGIGFWTSLSGSSNILTPDMPCSVVIGLEPGEFKFLWTVIDNVCNQFATDTLTVNYEESSMANTDVIIVPFAGSVTFDVTDNDDIVGAYTIEIIGDGPENGSLEDLGGGEFLYTVNPAFGGTEELFYRLCTDDCPDDCSDARIVLDVDKGDCKVPTIITPNNDGVNDILIVPCLASDEFPMNTISIFNSWGDEVFNASPYLNDWRGTFNGNDLPDGTYYFIMDYNGNRPAESGFIVIKR